MDRHCEYHSREGASWHCEHCALDLCTQCIPGGEDNFRPGQPRCPRCVRSLSFRGDGSVREPFWRVSPRLFAYAAQAPLLSAAVLAGLLGGVVPLANLFFQIVLVRYGLMVIEALARGDFRPLPLTQAMSGDMSLFFKQIGLFLLMFGSAGMLLVLNPFLGGAAFFLATLAIPAATMILAMTSSLLVAVNPVGWGRLMWAIGWSYLVLWFALTAVTSAPALVAAASWPAGWEGVANAVIRSLSFYTGLVGFVMMGYLLYEHADKLGLQAAGPRGKSLPSDEYGVREALGLSHVYAHMGRLEEALQLVDSSLQSAPADQRLHDRKFRLLRLLPDKEALRRFTEDYLRMLLGQGNAAVAASLYLDARKHLPGFIPAEPDIRFSLGSAMAERGRWAEAKQLLVNLHSQHPRFDKLGDAYLVLARVYLEGLGNTENAGKILAFLRKVAPATLSSPAGEELQGLYGRLRAL